MAEGLTHILFAFVLLTIAGWKIGWLDRRWVIVGMVGSLIPDFNRIDMLLDSGSIEATLGIPFSWGMVHTLGGVLVVSMIGAALFSNREQQLKAYGLLVAGGCSHLLLDAVKAWANGLNGSYLYPVSWWRNPTPGWYVSADRWVILVAIVVVALVYVFDRYVRRAERESKSIVSEH